MTCLFILSQTGQTYVYGYYAAELVNSVTGIKFKSKQAPDGDRVDGDCALACTAYRPRCRRRAVDYSRV